jgi:hypothetical protein
VKRGLLVVLLVSLLVAGVGDADATDALAEEEIDPDDVLLSVAIDESGDAAWTVEYRTRLDTNESERAFESFREDLESDPDSYRERFHDRMNATAADASTATGREMAVRNVSVSAKRANLPQEYGVVTYTFEWTNFAAPDGDRFVVGDAVDGLFLDEETSLLVEWPDGYALVEATPTPNENRERAVLWEGPTDFAGGEPRMRLAPETGEDDTEPGATDEGPSIPAVLLVVALLTVFAGIGAVAVRGDFAPFGEDESTAADPIDDELLSNEEQVLRLIERNDDRMKQAEVADELGWTDAKTSQVTKRLREEGVLDAFRLGRENVLELPDDY